MTYQNKPKGMFFMRMYKEHTPTPQELNETFKSMTREQKLQFEAIINMMTAFLIGVHQFSKMSETERKD